MMDSAHIDPLERESNLLSQLPFEVGIRLVFPFEMLL